MVAHRRTPAPNSTNVTPQLGQNSTPEIPYLDRLTNYVVGVSPKPHHAADNGADKANRKNADFGASKAAASRCRKWHLRGVLWQDSALKRVRECSCRTLPNTGGHVAVRRHEDEAGDIRVGYAGLRRCGSVWACPLCSTRINATRRLEVGALAATSQSRGYYCALQTITLRHYQGQALGMLFNALSEGQRGVAATTSVRRVRRELGLVGYVRSLEITYGAHGWHPHIHKLLVFEREPSVADLQRLADTEYPVWVRQCRRRGLGIPIRECYDIRPVYDADEAAQYLVKSDEDLTALSKDAESAAVTRRKQEVADGRARSIAGMAYEMTGGMYTKAGRAVSSMSPWQLLEEYAATGDMAYLDLWHEYERASKGRRQIIWSRGLKTMFGIGEVTDEEIAEREEGTRDDTLFWVTDWTPMCRCSSLASGLLNAVHAGGMHGGVVYCRGHGIPITLG